MKDYTWRQFDEKLEHFDHDECNEFEAEIEEEPDIPIKGDLLNLAQEFIQHLEKSTQGLERRAQAAYTGFEPVKHKTQIQDLVKRGHELYDEKCLRRECELAQEELKVMVKKLGALKEEKHRLSNDHERLLKIFGTITGLYFEAFKFDVEILSVAENEYKCGVNFFMNEEKVEHGVILKIDSKKKELIDFDVQSFCSPSEIDEFRKFYAETKNLPKLISKLRAKILELHGSKKINKK